MFGNYLAAAIRDLLRNKILGVLSILGLALGFAAALLIGLFVRNELTFDRTVPARERVYSVYRTVTLAATTPKTALFQSAELADQLSLALPQIESLGRMSFAQALRVQGTHKTLENVVWADPELFAIWGLQAIAGSAFAALQQPDGAILTRSKARQLFGTEDAVGRILQIELPRVQPTRAGVVPLPDPPILSLETSRLVQTAFTVGAVIDDRPSNSNLTGEVFLSQSSSLAPVGERNGALYFRVANDASPEAINQALARLAATATRRWREVTYTAVPVKDVHLRDGGSFSQPYLFLAIGFLVLFIASANFVNLMTLRGAKRGMEVGVRKTCGATRRDLAVQFMSEALLCVLVAMSIAILLAILLLPTFNAFMGRELTLDFGSDWSLVTGTALLALVTGLAAGLYPAVVLSSFNPSTVLKGGPLHAPGGVVVWETLVIVQFAILIALTVAATVISRQASFATNEALRFNSEQMLVVTSNCRGAFKDEVAGLPGVSGVACSATMPLNSIFSMSHELESSGLATIQLSSIDFGLFELYGLWPLAGRSFSEHIGGDILPAEATDEKPWRVVINDSARRVLEFPTAQAAIGARVAVEATPPSAIIGVVPDFPVQSVREPVLPAVYYVDPASFQTMSVKLRGQGVPETLAAIDSLWDRHNESRPIERYFLDDYIQQMYLAEIRQGQLLSLLATTAILIAALGLLGLSASVAERRTKEIGVRKVMGATRADILRLLIWHFSRPVVLANVIAWPAAYLAMRRWLEGYAYRIELEPWMFLGASLLAAATAILTVSAHAVLIARATPVTALRYE